MTRFPEEVHLWRCACPASPDVLHEFSNTLSDDERRRAVAYSRGDDGARFVTARGALRRILSTYVGTPPEKLKFRPGIFGKPRLDRSAGGAVSFNLSRAGNRLLIAVAPASTSEIGVDLVEIRTDHGVPVSCRELLADHFPQFARPEWSERECERAFARLWAQSEAILKARGTGLSAPSLPVGLCRLDLPLNAWRALEDGSEPGRVLCELAPIEGFASAVVLPGPMREIRIKLFSGDFERPLKAGVFAVPEVATATV